MTFAAKSSPEIVGTFATVFLIVVQKISRIREAVPKFLEMLDSDDSVSISLRNRSVNVYL